MLVAPFLPFFIAALLVVLVPGRARSVIMLATPVLGGLGLLGLEEGIYFGQVFLGFDLAPVRVDRLSLLFGYLFHIAAFIGIVYSLHLRDRVQHVAGLVYAGSALGHGAELAIDQLVEEAERFLGLRVFDSEAAAEKALEAEDFTAAMAALAKLREPVDDFFDRVTVNTENPELRANRLRLLARIGATLNRVADFSKIDG